MYTDDLNTCDIDMDYLSEATGEEYVLAGRNSRVDTNIKYCFCLSLGSILGTVAAMEGSRDNAPSSVQGWQGGKHRGKELVKLGAKCKLNMRFVPRGIGYSWMYR
jgi:hypothetical protein